MKPLPFTLVAFGLLFGVAAGPAAEVTTNGSGGGPWSDPATWRDKTVPGPNDDVVIRRGDVIAFDRNDDGKVTCQKLLIDPRGALRFKSGGKRICCVANLVESYGTIQLDATKSASDHLELRLVGTEASQRLVKLLKGGALLVAGRANLPGDGCNVVLSSPPSNDKDPDLPGVVEAGSGSTLDVQRSAVRNIHIKPSNIDNTGAKANERLNIVENRFTGQGRIECNECDSPVIAKNVFEYRGAKLLEQAAIRVIKSPLTEIRGNHIRGGFRFGIAGFLQTDSPVSGNIVEKCGYGVIWTHGQNAMIQQTTVRDCEFGFHVAFMTGVLEESTVEGCKTGLESVYGTMQVTSLRVGKLAKDGVAVLYRDWGELTLLNCNVQPSQIKLGKVVLAKAGEVQPTPVTAMHYLVIAAKDAPENAQVEVKTAKPVPPLAPGAADLNVRNAPATLVHGLTPLPQSFTPLIVKGWRIDATGKTLPAPEYVVRLREPFTKEGVEQKVLKSVTVTPQDNWFRPKPNDPAPTLEVSVK